MNFINKLLYLIGRILYFLFPPFFLRKYNNILNKIYTGWQTRNFKEIGKNCRLCRSVKIFNGSNITLGNHGVVLERTSLSTHPIKNHRSPELVIGDGFRIGESNRITCANRITIGENLLTGKCVTITDNSHGKTDRCSLEIAPNERDLYSKGPVRIGSNVWLGDNVIVLPNVTIGDSVVIGANSVVCGDIPSFSIAVGNPIKIIRCYS